MPSFNTNRTRNDAMSRANFDARTALVKNLSDFIIRVNRGKCEEDKKLLDGGVHDGEEDTSPQGGRYDNR